jgi:hypothetical protein
VGFSGAGPMRGRVDLASAGASRVVSRGYSSFKPPSSSCRSISRRRTRCAISTQFIPFVRRVLLPAVVLRRPPTYRPGPFLFCCFNVPLSVSWFTFNALRYDRTPATDRDIERQSRRSLSRRDLTTFTTRLVRLACSFHGPLCLLPLILRLKVVPCSRHPRLPAMTATTWATSRAAQCEASCSMCSDHFQLIILCLQ